jgi:hypothetical protein
MHRTETHIAPAGQPFNRAPETGGSEAVFQPGVHISKFDCEADWYAIRDGLQVLEMIWDSVANGIISDPDKIQAALHSVHMTLADANDRLGKTLELTDDSKKTEGRANV